VVVKGQVPGVAKQTGLFQDDLGHAKKPLQDMVSYSEYRDVAAFDILLLGLC
jgi:hypothetical protein